MYLDVCEHPVRIKVERKDGKKHWQYVSCGKCNTCRNHRASQWVERLEQESLCHAYTVFFTLTFDEKSVPRFHVSPDYSLVDMDSGYTIDPYDVPGFTPSSRLYLARRKNIPYATSKHLQDFFKRLRYYYENNLLNINENKKIRYFAVMEYGPTTFRPHFHGLLFFDSKRNARVIHELISKAWPFGRIDAQFSIGKSANYVARYVNCVASLPKVYLHRALRPFSVSSKCPAIGTLQVNSEEIREIFDKGLVERVIHSQRTHESETRPLWRTLENTLFPKIVGFNDLNHNERVTLYSVYRLCPIDGFENFLEWVKENILNYDTWLSRKFKDMYESDLSASLVPKFSRLKSLYYVSSRVYHQRCVFNVSLDYYVRKIENYYINKELWKLRNFYNYQIEFVKENGTASPLIFMYGDAINELHERRAAYYSLINSRPVKETSWNERNLFLMKFDSFELDFTSDLSLSTSLRSAEYYRLKDYSRMKSLNGKIVFDNTKSKKSNDYIDAIKNEDKFEFNLLKHYE